MGELLVFIRSEVWRLKRTHGNPHSRAERGVRDQRVRVCDSLTYIQCTVCMWSSNETICPWECVWFSCAFETRQTVRPYGDAISLHYIQNLWLRVMIIQTLKLLYSGLNWEYIWNSVCVVYYCSLGTNLSPKMSSIWQNFWDIHK